MKKTVAIIGAGEKTGALVAQRLVEAAFPILLADKEMKKAEMLQDFLAVACPTAHVDVVDCSFECAWEADVIFLAVPEADVLAESEKIRVVVTQKPVIRITDSVETMLTALPYSKVVKASCVDFIVNYIQTL